MMAQQGGRCVAEVAPRTQQVRQKAQHSPETGQRAIRMDARKLQERAGRDLNLPCHRQHALQWIWGQVSPQQQSSQLSMAVLLHTSRST